MGHSSLAMTSKYAHMRSDTLEAVNRTLCGDNKGVSIPLRR
jgi:hypothetical protein